MDVEKNVPYASVYGAADRRFDDGCADGISRGECERHRAEIARRLADGNVRFTRVETRLDSLVAISRIICAGVLTGVVSIIVILLTN